MLSNIMEVNNANIVEEIKKSDKPLLDAMDYRRTIRNYDIDYKIPQDQLDALLHAAKHAPTACNSQPFDFVVIRNVQKLDEVCNKVIASLPEQFQGHVKERTTKHGVKNVITCDAPCVILFVKNERKIPNFVDIDVGISSMAIMIGALQFGLDTMCLGFLRNPIVEEYFGLPKDSVAMGLAIGKVKGDRTYHHKDLIQKVTYVD